MLEALDARKLDVRPRQPRSGRQDVQRGHSSARDRIGGGRLSGEHLVEAGAVVARDAEPHGGVRLRIHVHQQGRVARLGDARAHVYRRRRLAYAPLLVRDRVERAHRTAS